MIGNYALMLIATGRLQVLEQILFLLTHIIILSCPFQRPVQLC